MAVVFRDGSDRDTVVRTACGGHVSSSSPVSHRGHAPADSSVVYRSTSNRLQIHAAWSDHGVVLPDERWTPYILEYMCELRNDTSKFISLRYNHCYRRISILTNCGTRPAFLDQEGGSQKATLVLVVIISSLKISKAFLMRSGAQRNFA